MKRNFVIPMTLAAVLASASIASAALAADRDNDREANALQGAKITLVGAIATAERQTGGQAYDAGVDTKGDQVRIVVETTGPKGVQTVSIDTQSGQVVGTHVGGEED
jgi:hypothetical protein